MCDKIVCKSNGILQKFFDHKDSAEVFFEFEDDETVTRLPAHKMILAAESPVFEQLFFGIWRETGDIPIMDVPIETFEIFLETFYGIFQSISMKNIYDIMGLAHEYQASTTMEYCEILLAKRLTGRNVFFALDLAIHYHRNKLRKSCMDFLKNGYSVFEAKGFSNCSHEVLKRILLDLKHDDAYNTFLHCIKWAKKSCDRKNIDSTIMANLRKELGDCFNLLQFSAMARDQFGKITFEYGDLLERYEIEAIQRDIRCRANF